MFESLIESVKVDQLSQTRSTAIEAASALCAVIPKELLEELNAFFPVAAIGYCQIQFKEIPLWLRADRELGIVISRSFTGSKCLVSSQEMLIAYLIRHENLVKQKAQQIGLEPCLGTTYRQWLIGQVGKRSDYPEADALGRVQIADQIIERLAKDSIVRDFYNPDTDPGIKISELVVEV